MAVDTANKRASAIYGGTPWYRLPIPDGSMDQYDRTQLGYHYRLGDGGTTITTATISFSIQFAYVQVQSPKLPYVQVQDPKFARR